MKLVSLSILALCTSVGLCAMEPAGEPVTQKNERSHVPSLLHLVADALLSEKFLEAYRKNRQAYHAQAAYLPYGAYDILARRPSMWKLLPISIKTLRGHTHSVASVTYGPDGLVTGSWDKTIRLWNDSGNEIKIFKGHDGWVGSVACSPYDQLLASGSDDGTVKTWNPHTGASIHTLRGHRDSVRSVTFGPEEHLLVSGSWDGTVKIWNHHTGSSIETLAGHEDSISSVVCDRKRGLLASGSYDNTVKIWDVSTASEMSTLEGHLGWVSSIAYGDDEKLLASGSWDGTIRIWDTRSLRCIRMLEGEPQVRSVAFGPDQLAAGLDDGTVTIWDTHTGRRIITQKEHEGAVNSVAYGPKAQLVSSSDDCTVTIWSPVNVADAKQTEVI